MLKLDNSEFYQYLSEVWPQHFGKEQPNVGKRSAKATHTGSLDLSEALQALVALKNEDVRLFFFSASRPGELKIENLACASEGRADRRPAEIRPPVHVQTWIRQHGAGAFPLSLSENNPIFPVVSTH